MKRISILLPSLFVAAAVLYGFYLPRFYVGFFNDDALYIVAAKALLQGAYISLNVPGHPPIRHFLPGYPLFLTPFVWVCGSHYLLLQFLSILLTLGSGALLWLILRKIASPGFVLCVMLLWLLNPIIAMYSGTVMSDPCFAFSVVLIFWFLQRSLNSRETAYPWALGGALTWASWIRPVGLLLIIGVAAGLVLQKRFAVARRALGVSLVLGGLLLLRNVWTTGTPTDYVSYWHTQWGWLIAHPDRVIHNIDAAIQFFLVEGLLGLLKGVQISDLGWIFHLLAYAMLFFSVAGVYQLKKMTSLPIALRTAFGAWIALYFLLHAFWIQDFRYGLPVVNGLLILCGLGVVSALKKFPLRHRRGLTAFALICWVSNYAVAHVLLLQETWSSHRPPESLLPKKTYSWIDRSVPPDARFLSRGAATYLYTGRYSLTEVAASDVEEFRYQLGSLDITYLLDQPLAIAEVEHQGGPGHQWTWDRERLWANSWPAFFQKVYDNPAEGTKIFEVIPNSSFMQAYDLYVSAQKDMAQGHETQARQKLTRALRLNPDFIRGLNASAEWALQAGQLSQAEGFLRRAVSLRPNHPLTHLHLARLYRLEKKPAAAEHELQACAATLAGTPELDDYQPLLNQELRLLNDK